MMASSSSSKAATWCASVSSLEACCYIGVGRCVGGCVRVCVVVGWDGACRCCLVVLVLCCVDGCGVGVLGVVGVSVCPRCAGVLACWCRGVFGGVLMCWRLRCGWCVGCVGRLKCWRGVLRVGVVACGGGWREDERGTMMMSMRTTDYHQVSRSVFLSLSLSHSLSFCLSLSLSVSLSWACVCASTALPFVGRSGAPRPLADSAKRCALTSPLLTRSHSLARLSREPPPHPLLTTHSLKPARPQKHNPHTLARTAPP